MRTVRMAWRNVWRNSRRSGITIAAMSFALWVMILYAGLVDGMLAGMETSLVELEVGDLSVVAEGYRDDPYLSRTLAAPDALLEGLDALGFAAAPRLLSGGLAAVGQESAGVSLVGIDVARDAQVTTLSTHLGEGAWLDPEHPKEVVLGKRLAHTLATSLGDEVVVLSQAADGSIANDLYTVRGILRSVGDGVDRTNVLLTAAAFRELMALPEGAHLVTVRVPKGTALEDAAGAVRALTPTAEVRTWKQLMPTLASMLESTRGLVQIVAFIVYVAVAILILNAMLMAVFERIREFGVMKAIGFGPFTVFSLIALESALQTLIATALGVALALPAMVYLARVGIDTGAIGGMSMLGMSMMQRWKGIYTLATVQGPVLILWLMVALAILWPAVKAARIRPIEAMRYR